jgi:hypothetical protein
MKPYIFPLLAWILLLAILPSCAPKETPAPPNPFDAIRRPAPLPDTAALDSSSLTGLHKFIFVKSCATPGCHDGHFEPDFRTVQSTYNTMVYHPVVKDGGGAYEYRVVPNSVEKSWLYNRLTTDDPVLGRMPLYDTPLNADQLRHIRNWINSGAPDPAGNPTTLPNLQPFVKGFAAYVATIGFRLDTLRDRNAEYAAYPLINNFNCEIWFDIRDDSTPTAQLQQVALLVSDDALDFSRATVHNATYVATPKIANDFFTGEELRCHWRVTLPTTTYPAESLWFTRLRVSDGSRPNPVFIPHPSASFQTKAAYAFLVFRQ